MNTHRTNGLTETWGPAAASTGRYHLGIKSQRRLIGHHEKQGLTVNAPGARCLSANMATSWDMTGLGGIACHASSLSDTLVTNGTGRTVRVRLACRAAARLADRPPLTAGISSAPRAAG